MNIRAAIMDPLNGKTSLSRVIWGYGLGGSLLLEVCGLLLPGPDFIRRGFGLFELVFSIYVCVATYQCARNARSTWVATLVRVSAVFSLILVLAVAYLDLSGNLYLPVALESVEM